MTKGCPLCGAALDFKDGFRQICKCNTPLIKSQALWQQGWVWMIDADKIHMSAPALWGAHYLPIKRMGDNKRVVNGFLFFESSKYVIRTAPAILQSANTKVKTAESTFDDIDAVLHEGWTPQSRIYDDHS
jgi:hypothetical protein